jgi:H+/Cl- antiporter ClcA/CBS domain-containing protein
MSERTFLAVISILAGLFSGIAAVILKNTVRITQNVVNSIVSRDVHNYIYFALPIIGVTITVLIIKFVVRRKVIHGIPNVLYGISKREGRISSHNLYSSIITSSLTVGFGGSVGLEGPTVATGTAWGSWLARTFRLNYKNTILILACACAGAMAAIFKAPIAAIVFAVEVIMIDLTVFSLVPLLLSSATGVVVSYLFLGQDVLYPFEVKQAFAMQDVPYYILLGIVAGLIAGVLHAPLTGIFLIADISGGYKLFVPLMITATFAYIVVRTFTPYSVYHFQLARRRELLTHDKDANVLQMLDVKKLIEDDFEKLSPEATLRDLTIAISRNHRNLFPVVDKEGKMKGMVKMDDVRELIFKQELYDKVKIKDLMYMPEYYIHPDDSMEIVANKFESSGRYNLAVIGKDGKYYGFISRARVFTRYRKQIIDVSHV